MKLKSIFMFRFWPSFVSAPRSLEALPEDFLRLLLRDWGRAKLS